MMFSVCSILIICVLHFNVAQSASSLERDIVYVSQLKGNEFDQIKIKGMDRVPYKIQIDEDSSTGDFFNPCSYKNGGCQHRCLIKSSTRYRKSSCACNVGYKLKPNLKDCELIVHDNHQNISEFLSASSGGHRVRRHSMGLFLVRSALRKTTRKTSSSKRRLRGHGATELSTVDANKVF